LRRGDPFSHPSGSSAGNQESFSGLLVLLLKASWSLSFLQLHLRPSHYCGTRKLSVPFRVHSLEKNFGFPKPFSSSESNPLLTHGAVESPANFFSAV